MRKQIVKCAFCKQDIDKETAYVVKGLSNRNQYYCDENHYQAQQNKRRYKPQKMKPNGTPNERRELTDWVQNYYIDRGYEKHTINWNLEMATLKNMMDKYDYKISGILLTLQYMSDILGRELLTEDNNSIFALVPFYYDECKSVYIQTREIQKRIKEFEDDDVVVVSKQFNKNDTRLYDEIDIGGLV